MNILLAITNYSERIPLSRIGESLSFGGMMLGIGILAVFSVLCLIWGALVIFRIVFYDIPNKKKAAPEAPAAPVVIEAPAAVTPAPSSDEELIAVFAAAIAMAESECNGAKFRVVSFRRK